MDMINRVILCGHVGRDPDFEEKGGERVSTFSVATAKNVERDGRVDVRHSWHRVIARGAHADLAEAVIRKGDRVYVEGSLEYDYHEKNGVSVSSAEVHATVVRLLPARPVDDEDAA